MVFTYEYPRPALTVDCVVFGLDLVKQNLKILLIKRNLEPYKDKWALPGGFVQMDENLEEAAMRELQEETGLSHIYLEQLYTFGDIKRDTRWRVISIAYFALVNSQDPNLKITKEKEAKWFSVDANLKFPFDHSKIFDYALKRLKWKFEYTPAAFSLLPKKFTLGELKSLYDSVFDKEFDKRNFMKKVILNEVTLVCGIIDSHISHP